MNNENKTITDEQFENMTVEDMMHAIYNSQFVENEDDAIKLVHQLMRISFRLLHKFDLDENEIQKDVLDAEQANNDLNQRIHRRTVEMMRQHPDKDKDAVFAEAAAEVLTEDNKKHGHDHEITPENMLNIMNSNKSLSLEEETE